MFGAIPATVLLIVAMDFTIASVEITSPYLKEKSVLIVVVILAAAGTVGLWRTAIQADYLNWLNSLLLLAGLLAMSPIVVVGIIEDPQWFFPSEFSKDSLELLLVMGPTLVAILYLCSGFMRTIRRR